jgi:hypothetical protein
MSKEVAAAILTKLYFEKLPNSAGNLRAPSSGAPDVLLENADTIGKVYAHFLGRLGIYESWIPPEKK